MPNVQPSPKELIGLGATIVGFVVLGVCTGMLLDAKFGSSPIATLVCLGLGIVGAGCALTVHVRKFMDG